MIREQLESYVVDRLAVYPDLENIAAVINEEVVEEGILPRLRRLPPAHK